jgi:hypothetical protein
VNHKLSKFTIINQLTDEVSEPFYIKKEEAETCRLSIFYSYYGTLDDIKYSFNNPEMTEAMHITMTVPDNNYNKALKMLNNVKVKEIV